jgi:hypothetical protein
MFADALTYPFRKGGWASIVTGAVFSLLLGFLQHVPVVGIAVAVFAAGFFAGFYLDIVSTTMVGDDHVPDWPSFTEFMDDIVVPLLRVIGLVLISFGPLMGLAIWFASTLPESSPQVWWAVGGAMLVGVFYFPMAVLGSCVYGNLFGAMPHVVLPGMWRAMPLYLLAVPGLAVAVGVCGAAEEFGGRIPFVGGLVAAAVALYSMMMQGRLIGLIYRAKREELGWE